MAALTFNSKGTSSFKQCPPGTHIAVCDMVVFLGLQPGSGMFPDPKLQLYMRFEIPALRVDYEKDGKKLSGPQVIGKTFTASMHKKANLRATLESWRGKVFTEEEASEFDIGKVLGKGCMIGVIQKESGGNIYSNIGMVSGLPSGVPIPSLENPAILYTGDATDDPRQLPEWLQKKLSEQVKPQASHATGSYAGPDEAGNYDFGDGAPPHTDDDFNGQGITDDDIPF